MRRTYLKVVWMMALLLLPASLLAQELAAIPPLRSPVVDVTGTLDAGQIQQLEQQALALQQRKGAQLQILIVPTTQPEAIEQYTQRVFDQWKIGRKGVDDGVLLLVARTTAACASSRVTAWKVPLPTSRRTASSRSIWRHASVRAITPAASVPQPRRWPA